MNKVINVGQKLGLTGCQLVQLQEANIVFSEFGVELLDGVQLLQRISRETLENLESLKNITIEFEPWNQSHKLIKKKKTKYILEQHKLAQMHYKGK